MPTNNTTILRENENVSVILHSTRVVQFDKKTITLDSGGLRTSTTKNRMNKAAELFGLNYGVYQQNNEWFITHKGKTIPFTDGMTLKR